MRKLRIAVVLFFILSCICFGVYELREWKQSDRNVPVINIEEDVLVVSASASEEELLAGVTAMDVEFGDLTDRIQIASMSPLVGEDERTIQYIVFDDADQLGTASRTVVYSDYVSPKIYLKEPLRFTTNHFAREINGLELEARDVLDGNLTALIRISYASDYGILAAGRHDITFQVNNSAGDTRILPLEMTVADAEDEEDKCYPRLSEYIVYTQVGEKLQLDAYLEGITVNSREYVFDTDTDGATAGSEGTANTVTTENTAFGRDMKEAKKENVLQGVFAKDVSIKSYVDYTVPGIYNVEYSYTTAEQVRAVTTLYVVVEE